MIENKQFEEWLITYELDNTFINPICATKFNELPFSMQWGVYLKYLDSEGFYLFEYDGCSFKYRYGFEIDKFEVNGRSRFEAQTEAIKKAFELLKNR